MTKVSLCSFGDVILIKYWRVGLFLSLWRKSSASQQVKNKNAGLLSFVVSVKVQASGWKGNQLIYIRTPFQTDSILISN